MISRKSDVRIGIGLLMFCSFAAWRSLLVSSAGVGATAGPTFVPWIMIAGISLLSVAMIVRALAERSAKDERTLVMPDQATLKRMAIFAVLLIAYAVAFMKVGYLASTLVVFALGLWLFGERRWIVLIAVPIAVIGAVYLGFTQLLQVWLP